MHVLINILLGAVIAFALKRFTTEDRLGYWRPLAGAVAGAFPYIDYIFWFMGPTLYAQHHFAETWSVYLMPFFGAGLAWGLGRISGKPWLHFLPITLVTLFVTIVLGAMTEQGLRLYTPFSQNYVAGQVVYSFDLVIFVALFFTVGLCFLLKKWQRDLSRVVLVLLVAYMFVLTTFHAKAEAFAHSYQRAMDLSVIRAEVMPQPLSPLNWRIIIHTTDDRLHDTLVTLGSAAEVTTDEAQNRTERVAALYKPLGEAVWRIYRRFGKSAVSNIARAAWVSHVDDHVFRWKMRYTVVRDIYTYNDQSCVRFRDLRSEGAKRDYVGTFLLCPPHEDQKDWGFYQAGRGGKYKQLYLF